MGVKKLFGNCKAKMRRKKSGTLKVLTLIDILLCNFDIFGKKHKNQIPNGYTVFKYKIFSTCEVWFFDCFHENLTL